MIALVGSYVDRGVNTADMPTLATTGLEDRSFSGTARGTRFGLSATGGTVFGAKLSGVLETDFFGGFPNQGIGEGQGLVRLRLAFAKMEWAKATVVMGQNWSVFAPMNPKTIVHTFTPAFINSGNLWQREGMISAGIKMGPPVATVAITLAAVQPIDGQGTTAVYSQGNPPGPSERSGAPAGEGRVGVSGKSSQLSYDAGFSGRMGTEKLSPVGPSIASSGFAGDAKISWGTLFWVQGEAFSGENLDTYFALDGNVVTNTAAVATFSKDTIKTVGGWVQAGVGHGPYEASFGYGEQTLDRDDFGPGNRTAQNQTWMGQVTYRPTKELALGIEYNYIETTSKGAPAAAAFTSKIARQIGLGMNLSF